MKLVDASETEDQVQAHRKEAVYQDQSQEVDVESFQKKGKNQKNNKKA
jgi:hypothetical protein